MDKLNLQLVVDIWVARITMAVGITINTMAASITVSTRAAGTKAVSMVKVGM